MPTNAPVRKPMVMAGSRPSSRAAAATRRLARTASDMPEVADRGREAGADQEEDRPEDPDHRVVGGQGQQQEERQRGEDAERPELPGQVGVGALLHRVGDVLHVVGALTGGKHFLAEHPCHRERAKRDQSRRRLPGSRLPPESSTTAGWIPVMWFLLGVIQVSDDAESTQRSGRRRAPV